jgi:endonuclease/exonuclease/phosphatase family metal-dependent hydrolase
MPTIRIMTYNVQGCRGGDGKVDPERVMNVIGEGAPDIVALQEVEAERDASHLHFLAERLGMCSYSLHPSCGTGFLSYYPLRGLQLYRLGQGSGCCLRADADIKGKRIHLLNLRLDAHPWRRRGQISGLLGPEIMGNRSLICPTLLLGDFGDLWWGFGNLGLSLGLRKATLPLWHATFPAPFPVTGRDRAYLRGELRVVDSRILRSRRARQASSHLPLVLTVQITDPRTFLRLETVPRNRKEIAPG